MIKGSAGQPEYSISQSKSGRFCTSPGMANSGIVSDEGIYLVV